MNLYDIHVRIAIFYRVFVIAAILTYSGCKKEEGVIPLIPDATSMEMDFSFTNKKISDTLTTNYDTAKAIVSFWANEALTYTYIPIVALKNAIPKNPEFDGESNTYTWSYPFSIGMNSYNANLTGIKDIEVDSISWEMTLLKFGSSEEPFLWFEGRSATNRSGGWWIIYSPSFQREDKKAILISWTKQSTNNEKLKYTNVIYEGVNSGAFIESGITQDADIKKYYNIHIIKDAYNKEISCIINWNNSNNKGYIQFGENKSCWDENFMNKDCNL